MDPPGPSQTTWMLTSTGSRAACLDSPLIAAPLGKGDASPSCPTLTYLSLKQQHDLASPPSLHESLGGPSAIPAWSLPCSCTLFSGLCTSTELTESRLS